MNNNTRSGIGLLDVILVVNIILKLIGVINWSWWVVLWPLWVSIAIIAIVFIIFAIIRRKM